MKPEALKQIKLLKNVNDMLEVIVLNEKAGGNLSANKQSVVNEMIMAKYKRVMK